MNIAPLLTFVSTWSIQSIAGSSTAPTGLVASVPSEASAALIDAPAPLSRSRHRQLDVSASSTFSPHRMPANLRANLRLAAASPTVRFELPPIADDRYAPVEPTPRHPARPLVRGPRAWRGNASQTQRHKRESNDCCMPSDAHLRCLNRKNHMLAASYQRRKIHGLEHAPLAESQRMRVLLAPQTLGCDALQKLCNQQARAAAYAPIFGVLRFGVQLG